MEDHIRLRFNLAMMVEFVASLLKKYTKGRTTATDIIPRINGP